MKPTVLVLVAGTAFGIVASSVPAAAHPPHVLGAPKAKAGARAEPPIVEITKKVKLSPAGLRFGMSVEEVSKLYEKVLEDEFVPLYQNVEPGPRMNELDAELADRKQLVMRNKLDFGSLPSGLDNTPLAREYTYNNGESMTQIKLRSGIQRYFFFMGGHLWKVYDIHKLGKKSKLGEDFDAVVAALQKQFGKGPRSRKADPSLGRNFDQVDWADKETIVRIIDHGGGNIGLVYVDRKIEQNIDKYRTNKGSKGEAVDRDVSDVTRPVTGGGQLPNAK